MKTPILQQLFHPDFERQLLQVQVLRLDSIHPVISGNKWLKLQPWLTLVSEKRLNGIVTKGGPWSNHVHAAAYAAHLEGLKFTAIIKAKKGMMTPMLEDARKWNATIEYYANYGYYDENHWQSFAAAQNSLYIPMGGEGILAVQGVSNYMNDLDLPAVDYIFCPVGTGTTFRGIAQSNLQFKKLIGINPGINDPAFELMLTHLLEAYPLKAFSILENKSLKKFGKWPAFLPVKMNEWYDQWQLPADIIYTGKMFFIFKELVSSGFFPIGAKVLLIHTGGRQGNRSLPDGILDY